MPLPFDKQLALNQGKIHHVNMADDFARYRDGLLYYWNKAEELHLGAQIIHEAHGHPRPRDVFALLAGLSIEVLLKGILRALDNQTRIPTHYLHDLCREAGILISDDDRIILQALSEHVAWASRYPTPIKLTHWLKAMNIFDKQRRKSANIMNMYIAEREINWENYARLWELFATHYHKACDARPESVELWFHGDQ